VVELHFQKGRTHAGNLAGRFAGALAETGRTKRQPAEHAQAGETQRHRDRQFAADAEENSQCQNADAAGRTQQSHKLVCVGFGENARHP
jgi:hypothetical protein